MRLARLALTALILALLLAACNLAAIKAPAPTVYPTPQPLAADAGAQGLFPSITPLAVNGTSAETVYITATPIPGAAAQTIYVTATPFGLGAGSGIVIAITPGSLNPTLAPTPTSTNVIDSIINNLLIPAWNFLYTLVLSGLTSLWNTAGARGGLVAQGLCCLIPGVIVIVVVVRLALLRRPHWLR